MMVVAGRIQWARRPGIPQYEPSLRQTDPHFLGPQGPLWPGGRPQDLDLRRQRQRHQSRPQGLPGLLRAGDENGKGGRLRPGLLFSLGEPGSLGSARSDLCGQPVSLSKRGILPPPPVRQRPGGKPAQFSGAHRGRSPRFFNSPLTNRGGRVRPDHYPPQTAPRSCRRCRSSRHYAKLDGGFMRISLPWWRALTSCTSHMSGRRSGKAGVCCSGKEAHPR
jgi:hypothetical protein